MYCEYYQAKAVKETIWFVHGCLRNEENLVFDRTLDKNSDCLEFFVTKEMESSFIDIMQFLQQQGYIIYFEKLTNRLLID